MATELARHLLSGIIDYAGLFPPAKLDMQAAVEEFDRQRRGEHAWMLGRFVVPVGRLDELEAAAGSLLPRDADATPWGLSVLVSGDAAQARPRLDAFDAAHANPEQGLARVESVEFKPQSIDDIAPAAAALQGIEVFFELPHQDDPTPWMEAVATAGGLGKIRSGGVTADAFPSAAEVARFIAAAHRVGIGFKATAGLHHPLRGEYRLTYEDGSPQGTMHGFLNVFTAAAAARSGVSEDDLAKLLEERQVDALSVTADGLSWNGHRLEADQLSAMRRQFAYSYGSCSFSEPVEDLQALGIL